MYTDLPVAHASESERSAYLRKVAGLTAVGLGIATVASFASMAMLLVVPGLLSGWAPMLFLMGTWAIINFVAQPMVFGEAKWAGFVLGTGLQGVAMGFLLLVAAAVSMSHTGNPLLLAGFAAGLTGFTGLGLGAYVSIRPGTYSTLGAFLSASFIPMLIIMAVGLAFPSLIGGMIGVAVSAFFVFVSAAGLLYQLNLVIHRFSSSMYIEGAYTVTMGILVLFWNILSLLMRLTRR